MTQDDHQEQSSKELRPALPRDKAKSTISTFTIIAALIGLVPIPMADAPADCCPSGGYAQKTDRLL